MVKSKPAKTISNNFWRGKNVFVTGGAGFIGSHLVEQLVYLGSKVTVLVNPKSKRHKTNLSAVLDKIRIVPVILEDENAVVKKLKNVDALFHLAAYTGGLLYSKNHQAEMCYKNLRPFVSVLEAARRAGIGRFLVCSSACIYPAEAKNPIPEEEGTKGLPEPTNMGYGLAKRMAEYLGAEYAKNYGMHVAIARPFNAYGPRDNFDPEKSHVIPALIRKILKADKEVIVWGTGNATRAFLYTDDFARGLIAVAEKGPVGQPINIGPGEAISIRDLTYFILKLCGKDNLKVVFDKTKPEGQFQRSVDTSRAEELLGFHSEVPLAEGIKRTIDWFQTELKAGRQKL